MANEPWLLRADAAPRAIAALERCAGQIESSAPRTGAAGWPEQDPGYDIAGGVAVVGVRGVLINRLGMLRPLGRYATGYDGIRQAFLGAMVDPQVRAIALDIDSPGGMVSGAFDLADAIYASRGRGKAIWSILSEEAYSAAYLLASATDRVLVPRTGGAGSVGVITMLVDLSGMLKEAGVAVHFVHYGERKAEEGRAQLTGVKPELLGRIQSEIDRLGEMFVGTVARNRGLSVEAVRAQQAGTYPAELAVGAGLADAVMAPDEAFRALRATL